MKWVPSLCHSFEVIRSLCRESQRTPMWAIRPCIHFGVCLLLCELANVLPYIDSDKFKWSNLKTFKALRFSTTRAFGNIALNCIHVCTALHSTSSSSSSSSTCLSSSSIPVVPKLGAMAPRGPWGYCQGAMGAYWKNIFFKDWYWNMDFLNFLNFLPIKM